MLITPRLFHQVTQIQPEGCSPLDAMSSVTQTKCPGGPSAPANVLTECLFQKHSWYQPFMWFICQASLHGDKVFVLQLEDRLGFRSNDAASEKMLPRHPVSEGEQPRTGVHHFFGLL